MIIDDLSAIIGILVMMGIALLAAGVSTWNKRKLCEAPKSGIFTYMSAYLWLYMTALTFLVLGGVLIFEVVRALLG